MDEIEKNQKTDNESTQLSQEGNQNPTTTDDGETETKPEQKLWQKENPNQSAEPYKMFSNLFSSKGRINRTEYWITSIICYAAMYFLVILFACGGFGMENSEILVLCLILLIIYVLILWFLLTEGAKRCHDMGVSGWCQIIPFFVFWLLFAKGEDTDNKYGPARKSEQDGKSL